MSILAKSWIERCKKERNSDFLTDSLGTSLSSMQALTSSILLSRKISALSKESVIGIMLPTSVIGMLCNMAGIIAGKTIVNINYTASSDAIQSALTQADIKTIYTSRKFLEKLRSYGFDIDRLTNNCQLIFLEDFKTLPNLLRKLATSLMAKVLPASTLIKIFCFYAKPDDAAVILFSSGSEGIPKGVILSHLNIMTNVEQIAEVLKISNSDAVLANLPLFHAFGLTVTMFMPMILGIKIVCHTDPREVVITSKLIHRNQATIIFGTSTFYRLYIRNKQVKKSHLESLRIVIAGAEKLQEEIRLEFKNKFGKEILEGYGTTETAPVASVNMPDNNNINPVIINNRPGSVGKPLPGTCLMIIDPDTGEVLPTGESGMILISGKQVMKGYLNNEQKTREALVTLDSTLWYRTGDKGYLDQDGFLYIEDRYSRFAKIAGEMVSLNLVEDTIKSIINDFEIELIAVSVPDKNKGEIILILINKNIDQKFLKENLGSTSITRLAYPSDILVVNEIPKLSTGKRDFVKAKELALAHLNNHNNE